MKKILQQKLNKNIKLKKELSVVSDRKGIKVFYSQSFPYTVYERFFCRCVGNEWSHCRARAFRRAFRGTSLLGFGWCLSVLREVGSVSQHLKDKVETFV